MTDVLTLNYLMNVYLRNNAYSTSIKYLEIYILIEIY